MGSPNAQEAARRYGPALRKMILRRRRVVRHRALERGYQEGSDLKRSETVVFRNAVGLYADAGG